MTPRSVSAALLIPLALTGSVPTPARGEPARAINVPVGSLLGSANDGKFALAVPSTSHRYCYSIEVRDGTGRLVRTVLRVRGRNCVGLATAKSLFVAGGSALVSRTSSFCAGICIEARVYGYHATRTRLLGSYDGQEGYQVSLNTWFSGAASDGKALLWGWWQEEARIHQDPTGGCLPSCRFRVGRSALLRWNGGRVSAIADAPPPYLLAAGDGLAAIATFPDHRWRSGLPELPEPVSLIDVISTSSGALLATTKSPSRDGPGALAVSRSWLVALDPEIRVWRLPGGRKVRTLRLPQVLANDLSYPPEDGSSGPLSLNGSVLVLQSHYGVWTLRLPQGALHQIWNDRTASVRDAVALANGLVALETCGPRECQIHILRTPTP